MSKATGEREKECMENYDDKKKKKKKRKEVKSFI